MEGSLRGYEMSRPLMSKPLMFGELLPFVYCCSKAVVYLLWVRVRVRVMVMVRVRVRVRARSRARVRARVQVRVRVKV